MYKNQLQELAQRSCFNLPSYACIREGPDHAPRFKASVNFNGEIFECPSYCTTLRQAEHAAAEVALNTLSNRGPARSLAARVLDETGVYKNLLQETAHRAGLNLPVYTTVRSGPGHLPVFTCTVELATMNFTGEPAKTKKQAEKNAAMAAWSALKQLPNLGSLSPTNRDTETSEEQEQVVVARALSHFRPRDEHNRSVRHRDQQSRRRMMLGYRDNNNNNNIANQINRNAATNLQYQQWRSLDLLTEIPIYQQQHINNHSRFQNISAIPVQIRNRSQVRIQEIPPPLEEHQKDEEQWLNCKSEVSASNPIERDTNNSSSSAGFKQKTAIFRPFLLQNPAILNPQHPDQNTQQAQIRNMCFVTPQPPLMATPVRSEPGIPPRFAGSCEFRARTMAPAVKVRSVIPVCAAPPMSRSPSPNPPKKESSSEAEISRTSSKLNKLQL